MNHPFNNIPIFAPRDDPQTMGWITKIVSLAHRPGRHVLMLGENHTTHAERGLCKCARRPANIMCQESGAGFLSLSGVLLLLQMRCWLMHLAHSRHSTGFGLMAPGSLIIIRRHLRAGRPLHTRTTLFRRFVVIADFGFELSAPRVHAASTSHPSS